MNRWLKLSLDYANRRNYLDDLFRIYPTIPEGIREVDADLWYKVEKLFKIKKKGQPTKNDLIKTLLKFKLFPIKDSYVAYLKKDSKAIERNPNTINRLCGRLFEIGLDEVYKRCSEPKETNRQIGPMFKEWIKSGALGIKPVKLKTFEQNKNNAILEASDKEMKEWAKKYLNYDIDKGLDFVARFNKQYVIGEAKFLTDFGGHQNAQFNDAIRLINSKKVKALKVAILDGVLYIKRNTKMHKSINTVYKNQLIMSCLVLRDFLYSI